MSSKVKYVIQSGNGFLLNPESGQMIANSKNPEDAMLLAKRYDSQSEAEKDCVSMQKKGMRAEIVEIRVVEYDKDTSMLIVEALHEAGLITTMDCMQAMKVIQKELRKWSK